MIDINEATVEQLKALAYDQLVTLQTAQNNLAALNKAIEFKQSPQEQPKEEAQNGNTSDNTCA